MLNVSERLSSPNVNPPPASSPILRETPIPLGIWLHRVLGQPLQTRQRGNVVYVLCEGMICPDRAVLTQSLTTAIATASAIPRHLTPDGALVHRIVLYGRAIGSTKPAWGETFELPDETDCSSETAELIPQQDDIASASAAVLTPSIPLKALRHTLSNEGIAHHLSHQLSSYNIAVRVRRKQPLPSNDLRSTLSRLYVVCESTYAPDPNIIAEPLAQCLRALALGDCKDAIISGQAKGESDPEWMLRVDLTPADQLLRQRAKWGDMDALSRLLTPMLRSVCQSLHITLDQTTLHIAARHSNICPPQTALVKAIEVFLTDLSPHGIHGASIYGILTPKGASESVPETAPETTQWVHWLDLPATHQVELTASPEDLAARGNAEAIAQLLLRHLNPNLDRQLATGGIRVQVRQRESVLHIMTDSLMCPNQKAVSTSLLNYLPSLHIDGISGLCIYGRQAGHNHASWRQGVQLGLVQTRFVPASTPEFTASDSYVDELLSPPGALVFMPRREPKDWGKAWSKTRNLTRSILLKTAIFAPISANQRLIPIRDERVSGRVALVWGLLGLCMMISSDWALGVVLKSRGIGGSVAADSHNRPAIAAPTALPTLSLNKSGIVSDASAFNASGFTQDGKVRTIPSTANPSIAKSAPSPTVESGLSSGIVDSNTDANLPVSPLMPKAQVDPTASPYPSLNAAQLDDRLALYQQYVAQFGVPDVMVVGSSRALRGIDPSALQETLTQQGYSGVRAFNFGINGATAQVIDLLLRRLITPDQLPKTIVWADGARAFNSGRTDVTFNAIATSDGYKRLPIVPVAKLPKGKSADKNGTDASLPDADKSPKPFQNALTESYQKLDRQLQDWLKSISSVGSHRDELFGLAHDRVFGQPSPITNSETSVGIPTVSLSPTGQGVIDIYGFLPLPNQFNPATYYQKYSKVSGAFDSDYDSFELQGKQQDALESIAQFSQARGISLVFINLPLTSEYLDARRREYEDQFQRSMIQASTALHFTYRDLSGIITQQNALFSDPSHLNRYGAYEVSVRLARDPLIRWSGDRSGKSAKK